MPSDMHKYVCFCITRHFYSFYHNISLGTTRHFSALLGTFLSIGVNTSKYLVRDTFFAQVEYFFHDAP